MPRQVITRFAPSPTGYLHIGGARTALFNWVYAKKNNGKMLLRIEDTDQKRSTDAAQEAILDGLSWLGIDWDDEPVSQIANAERHKEIAEQLVENNLAYRCYCSSEELVKMREEAKAKGLASKYSGKCRDLSDASVPTGIEPVIRLKIELSKEIIVKDHVQGDVKFNSDNFDDFIILRSNGTPTYMLAVVVDDHDMGITHIIRGDDHLTNAARQIMIYNALGWDVPEMAHIPLIHGADGAKLSKRHGALGVDAYRKMGYLPKAIRNYLARLGWSHGNDEVFSTEQMINWFDLDDLNKGASRFDFVKLANLNAHYIKQSDEIELFEIMISLCKELELTFDEEGLMANKETVLSALKELKPRAKTILDLIELARFIYATRPLQLDEKASNILTDENKIMIGKIITKLNDLTNWSLEEIKNQIKEFADENEQKLGKVAQPLRAALTGSAASPSIFDVMVLIGKDESLNRLKDQATFK
ncbi:MAG: glutamate--tRNA ligase [Devosiaceae bacterium]|nr:glutamate--tRNA ligase [Devosiaceae bacterium]